MIRGKKVGNYQEIIELDNVEESKKNNRLWKTWKNKNRITKYDVFKQLSYGHNKADEFREYDAILRHELDVKLLQFESEEEDSNSYLFMLDYETAYFARSIGRNLTTYVFAYMEIVGKAFDNIALQYNTDTLTDIYPDLTYFNYRKVLMPGEVEFVDKQIFKGDGLIL